VAILFFIFNLLAVHSQQVEMLDTPLMSPVFS